MPKYFRSLVSLPLLIVQFILLFSCKNTSGTSENEAEVRTPVTIIPVTIKSVSSTVGLPAVTSFQRRSILRATTTGTIDRILIAPGDYVRSGQLLFTIRTKESMAINKEIPGDSTLSFKGVINISSKADGVINSISYQKGDFVLEGDEMAALSEQKSLIFILDVPFELEKFVAKNRRCNIMLPDNRVITGTVSGKLAEMDIQSQTIRYIVEPLTPELFPANMMATITLVKSVNESAIILPKQAVLGNETQTEFWVMKLINDTLAIKIDVKKGFENNEEVEITEPTFLESDRIVLTGGYGLPDTAKVVITK
jgi:biotin carboxyl carrier protein